MAYFIAGNSLIQSTFTNNGARSFEAVVYWPAVSTVPPEKQNTLQHFWRDNSRPDRTWEGGITFCHEARDAGSIIQASNGNFEVVVPHEKGLVHYWRDNSTSTLNWSNCTMVAEHSSGPGSMVENRENGHLEVVVRHSGGLRHFWRADSGWQQPGISRMRATKRRQIVLFPHCFSTRSFKL
jgi:hypothetical protein